LPLQRWRAVGVFEVALSVGLEDGGVDLVVDLLFLGGESGGGGVGRQSVRGAAFRLPYNKATIDVVW